MSIVKDYVTIKGNKDGLIFILNEECEYKKLIHELEKKLHESRRLLSGPEVKVRVHAGKRKINEKKKKQISDIIGRTRNLIVEEIEYDGSRKPRAGLKVISGVIRSGQTVEHPGDLMLLGDLNPGGVIRTGGSLFVLGALRGLAHAGKDGDSEAVIAASRLMPTQLKIADILSRPPDEWGVLDAAMEFAYLQSGVMKIDRIHNLHKVRPQLTQKLNGQQ